MRRVDVRTLNRTLLDRQLLLRRRRLPALDAVERLVGLQAQVPRDPYVALWSRLSGFDPSELATAMLERRAVRMGLIRSTLHLVTDRDALRLRPVVEPVVQRVLHGQSPYGRQLAGVDVEELIAIAIRLLEEAPRTRAQLAPVLAERWPDHDAAALAYAVTYLLWLVQVTPRGVWGRTGPSAFTTLQHWLGRQPETSTDPAPLVLRYLAAFGPATPADVQTWSGLTGIGEVLDGLRPQLRTYRDETSRDLFDVEGARLRDRDTPAPVRFLPEYDNVVLGHADRSRIVSPETRRWIEVGWGMVLVDGFTAARWKLAGGGTLAIEPFGKLSAATRGKIEGEAHRLASFLGAATADVVISRAPTARGA